MSKNQAVWGGNLGRKDKGGERSEPAGRRGVRGRQRVV